MYRKLNYLNKTYLGYMICVSRVAKRRFQIIKKYHVEARSPLKDKNTQPQVNFPGFCIKKSAVLKKAWQRLYSFSNVTYAHIPIQKFAFHGRARQRRFKHSYLFWFSVCLKSYLQVNICRIVNILQ